MLISKMKKEFDPKYGSGDMLLAKTFSLYRETVLANSELGVLGINFLQFCIQYSKGHTISMIILRMKYVFN